MSGQTKRKNKQYSYEDLQQALQSIKNEDLTYRGAMQRFNIPEQTLRRHIIQTPTRTAGNRTNLSPDVENELVTWIIECNKVGSGPTRKEIIQTAAKLAESGLEDCSPFKNVLPSDKWFTGFLKRHPQISRRSPSLLTSASSKVSKANIIGFIKKVDDYLHERLGNRYEEVMNDPRAFGNSDETNFELNPTPTKVYAERGSKQVYCVQPAKAKEGVSVMYTFLASGDVLAPQLILKNLNQVAELAHAAGSVGANYYFCSSENGWQTQETFFDYVSKQLIKELDDLGVRRTEEHPFIYFFDGHKSHISFKLFTFCKENHIIPIVFYPNATHILQMADVGMFGPAKQSWKKEIQQWKLDPENKNRELNLIDFVKLLKKITDKMHPETIKKGFKATGIFPLDVTNTRLERTIGAEPQQNPVQEPVVEILPLEEESNDASENTETLYLVEEEQQEAENVTTDESTNFLNEVKIFENACTRMKEVTKSMGRGDIQFGLDFIVQLVKSTQLTPEQSNHPPSTPSSPAEVKKFILTPPPPPMRKLQRKFLKTNHGPMTTDSVLQSYENQEKEKKNLEIERAQRIKIKEQKKMLKENLIKIKIEKDEEKKAAKRRSEEAKLIENQEPKKKRGRPVKIQSITIPET